MEKKIAILNNYADEPPSAPSANYFTEFVDNTSIINICHDERINKIQKYDAYIISGSRSCHKEAHDWIKYLKEIISDIYSSKIPCLAVCFGHQIVAEMFGGKTVVNSNGEEGFQEVPTISNGDKVNLFKNLSNPTKIYQSHIDAVIEAPKQAHNIIINDKCVQHYELGLIYSIQSHPEISVSNAIKIAKRDNQNIEEILNGVTEGNNTSHLVLQNFVNLI